MKRKTLHRALGFVLTVILATSNLTTTVFAAELETPVVEEITEDSVDETPMDNLEEDEENPLEEDEEELAEEPKEDEEEPTEEPKEDEVASENTDEAVVAEPTEEEKSTNEVSTMLTMFSSAEEMNAYLWEHPNTETRLVLISDEIVTDYKNATTVVGFNGLWVLDYKDTEICQEAFNEYRSEGATVEYDSEVEAFEDDEIIKDVTPEDVPENSVEAISEDNEKENEAAEVEIEEPEEIKDITVAIIDTGLDMEDELLKDRISDRTADGMVDTNGHGTVMAEIVASQTAENVKVLPINAFDENGKSTVAKVYFAIEEAIANEADVINISACGIGASKALEIAVADARNANIPVIVAAGNDASDTKDYMPANIPDAITVSAVDKDENIAEYSNFGADVDFSALGILVKDMGTEETEDDLIYIGTSISSAYASAYAAIILADNEDADIYGSFLASVTDLGDEGRDDYYGYGLLTKENIVSVIKEREEGEEETSEEDIEDILDEEGEEELDVAYVMCVGYEFGGNCYSTVGKCTYKKQNYANGHMHIGTCSADTTHSAKFCTNTGYDPNGPWRIGTYIGSRNPSDGLVFDSCHFTNMWIENFFDVTYNKCTFENCSFSTNGGGNTLTFNDCTINANGYSGGWATQANPDKINYPYAGIVGGNQANIILNRTTLNATGATCGVSNSVQSGYAYNGQAFSRPSITVQNSSVIYGASQHGIENSNWGGSGGNVTIDSSSSIYDCAVAGLYNSYGGTAYIKSGSIYNSGNGVENYSTVVQSGGEIYSNTTGVMNQGVYTQAAGIIRDSKGNGVINNGTYSKTGGENKKNGDWGVYNSGTTNITSDKLQGNVDGGIYQNGTLNMSGNGRVESNNQIFLTKGHIINVTGALNTSLAGTINTAEGDRATGRELIKLYVPDTNIGASTASKFTLAFKQNDNTHTLDAYSEDGSFVAKKGTKVQSLVRAGYGTDQNAPTNEVILSGMYYSVYEQNMELPGEMKATIPIKGNRLYYGEKILPKTKSHAYTTGESNKVTVELKKEDGDTIDISNSLRFLGWALDENETDKSKIYTTDQVRSMKDDFHWYAIWDANFDLYFDGNKQTTGKNYRKDDLSLWDKLPGNVGPKEDTKNYFTKKTEYKAEDKTWYDDNREEYIDYTLPYSYQGWSLRDNAKYNDIDVVNPEDESKDTLGEALELQSFNAGAKWLTKLIKEEKIKGFDEAGRAIIPIYVVWDEYPVIEAYDVYVTKNELVDLSEDDLWDNVDAKDREDGTLNNKTDVTIIDFNKDELADIEGDRGGASVTYKATDGAGNVTFYDVMVIVTSNEAMTSWTPNADGSKRMTADYVRFIDRENYEKHSTADGAMEEHSVWYTKPDYVKLITTAFDNIESGGSVISYELDVPTMQAIQSYNKAHFNEVLEQSFRTNFYKQFCKPNVISGSLDKPSEVASR